MQLFVYACCVSDFSMCGKCPWRHTDDCRDTILEEENVKMKLSEIKISNAFASTTPREDKVNVCRNYWEENHEQDRDIVVNKNNVLIDGYIQYLVLKENGIDEVFVKKLGKKRIHKHVKKDRAYKEPTYKNSTTTYIRGVHLNRRTNKEYIWRVPNSWKGWENDLLPGDVILVRTQYGVKPIVITNIEWRDKCPVDMRVRKVYRKC